MNRYCFPDTAGMLAPWEWSRNAEELKQDNESDDDRNDPNERLDRRRHLHVFLDVSNHNAENHKNDQQVDQRVNHYRLQVPLVDTVSRNSAEED